MLTEKFKNRALFSSGITLVYFLLSLYGILHHEIWSDEAHCFVMARDSISLKDLIKNVQCDGHPWIWYILLWFITKISHNVFYMQLLNILITTLNVFLILRFSPFRNFKKILFVFSYYFFYEYNIISRNYSLCLLGVTVFCIFFCAEKRNYILLAFLLALFANTHFMALLISIPLALVMFVIFFNEKEKILHIKRIWFIAFFIIIAGYVICAIQIIPPLDTMVLKLPRSEFFSIKRWSAFSVFLKGLYQFPDILTGNSWNSNLFTSYKIVGIILTIFLLFATIKAFSSKPLSLFIIISSYLIVSLFLFSELLHNYSVRHWGFIFLGFYAALWIEESIDQKPCLEQIKKHIPFPFLYKDNTQLRAALIYSVLVVQVLASAYVYAEDIKSPFSNSRNIADYIHKCHYDNDLIIMSPFTQGPAVSAYLNKKIYYAEYHDFGSFGLGRTWPIKLATKDLLKEISTLKKYKRAILIVDDKIPETKETEAILLKNKIKIQYLAGFEKSMIKSEQYYIYLISYAE